MHSLPVYTSTCNISIVGNNILKEEDKLKIANCKASEQICREIVKAPRQM